MFRNVLLATNLSLTKTFSGNGLIPIPVRLELQDIPDRPGNMTKIFDTDESRTMYKDHLDYVIALNPPVITGCVDCML